MLRNRKEQSERKLVGVNRVADPSKLKLGTFELLQNWIPAKRYKIKKKRGVEALVDSPDTPVIPTNCGICTNQFPAVQNLPAVCCFDNTSVWSSASETSGQISYVNPSDYSFWCLSGTGNGFGGSDFYPDGASSDVRVWASAPSCSLTDISATGAVPFTGFTAKWGPSQAAQSGRSGHSDEKSYMVELDNVSPSFFNGATSGVIYFGESSGAVPTLVSENCAPQQCWTKYGSQIFQATFCNGSNITRLRRWPIPFANNTQDATNSFTTTGGVPLAGSPVPGLSDHASLRDLFANANYLYALARGSEWANPKICQINKSTLAFIQSWDITNSDFANVDSMYVFSDNLVFLLDWNNSFRIGFINLSTGVTTTIGSVTSTCPQSSNFHASNTIGFQYAKNYFFIGNDGGNVLQVGPLLCPGQTDILWES